MVSLCTSDSNDALWIHGLLWVYSLSVSAALSPSGDYHKAIETAAKVRGRLGAESSSAFHRSASLAGADTRLAATVGKPGGTDFADHRRRCAFDAPTASGNGSDANAGRCWWRGRCGDFHLGHGARCQGAALYVAANHSAEITILGCGQARPVSLGRDIFRLRNAERSGSFPHPRSVHEGAREPAPA